jgi:hypothetical protein
MIVGVAASAEGNCGLERGQIDLLYAREIVNHHRHIFGANRFQSNLLSNAPLQRIQAQMEFTAWNWGKANAAIRKRIRHLLDMNFPLN